MTTRIWLVLGIVAVLGCGTEQSQIDQQSLIEADRLRSGLDDPISHVDYLITIYSPSTSKPCSYFCNFSIFIPFSSLLTRPSPVPFNSILLYCILNYLAQERYSQAESSLINCTWYKTNACKHTKI